jgi:hypothetical protein
MFMYSSYRQICARIKVKSGSPLTIKMVLDAIFIAKTCSQADSSNKVGMFSDISGTDFIPAFRVLLMAW